ncbi:MAG TPA: hypothetical protein PL125_02830 [Candidatus Omnitrophota bacterium]|nr:hypothetical protein [Candidatus Omnitrophota bacterium]HPT39115.1 hypothetical protein [Candidatus Omnitrophota bacterium]
MNRNALYLAIFAVLCVLAGVLMGASITKWSNLPGPGRDKPDFRKKAEYFMGYGSKERKDRKSGGPIEMLAAKLELSTDQKVKITGILEKSRQEIDQVGDGVRNAITQIKEKGDQEIMAMLNPKQQEKFKDLLAELKRKHDLRKGRGQLPPFGERFTSPRE